MNFFITGGSRGIGADIVRGVLGAGHNVAFTYVERENAANSVVKWAQENAPDRTCRAYRLDVRDSDAVEQVVDQVNEDFDDIQVVINNAAVNRLGLAVSMSNENWQDTIDVNLTGAFYVTRQFLPTFLSNRSGRFIHISSVAMNGMAGLSGYSASKAGLSGLSSSVAKEYGRKGITSNMLMLGFFDTDMTREQMPEHQKAFWQQFCPVGRMGKLNEITEAVLFLSSDKSGFVNGETISLTGGLQWAP